MANPSSIHVLVGILVLPLLLSHLSILAAQFEGFDSDDVATANEDEFEAITFLPSTPPLSSSFPPSPPPPPPPPPPPLPHPPPTVDIWDEDEFEGIPFLVPDPIPSNLTERTSSPDSIPSTSSSILFFYTIEISCVAFLIFFSINYFTGKRHNEAIALAWASKFAAKDSIFDKNFSLLGTGDGQDTPLLLKEGNDVFKFYANGRRYCQGLFATMELRRRYDLVAKVFDVMFAKKDTITFEVMMNEEAMDHVILAVATKKVAKTMQKEAKDLGRFAVVVNAAPTGRRWVADELLVIAESKEVAGDLITDVVLDQVFGDRVFEKFGKWFISFHFSDQQPGSHKKILTFKFVLPDANSMGDMMRLVSLVPYYIDLIGRYKLSSHARSKTEAARVKAAQEAYKEHQNVRQQLLQKKKAEKKKLMKEAATKLSAEVLRRKEEKVHGRQMKKATPRVKMPRS